MRKILLMVACLSSVNALADKLILDPNKIQCKIEDTAYGFSSCNVYYDGAKIFKGRGHNLATVTGDCVKCKSVVASAKTENNSVILNRDFNPELGSTNTYDWYNDEFFKVDGNSKCDY
jgi:hypothetical protein